MRRLTPIHTVAVAFLAMAGLLPAAVESAENRIGLVACAPGYPGTAEQAQPLMDRFASTASTRFGLPLAARYEPALEKGIEAIRDESTSLALVPLSFYLEQRESLALTPILSVAYESGATERWSLVAAKGRISSGAALDRWRLTATPGYSPRFVRSVALAGWEELPDTVTIAPTSRVLSELRKAAQGEDVAVLLDRAQADALPKLPFAADLQVVTRSAELPAYLLCEVAGRLGGPRRAAIRQDWIDLHRHAAVREAMAGIRIEKFLPLDESGVKQTERQFAGTP